MKKFTAITLGVLSLFTFAACKDGDGEPVDVSLYSIENGGFETGDLTGWTVESGKAFSEENVCTKSTFSFQEDENHNKINIGQSGNWHLYGKGFDDRVPNSFTGVLRSSNFILGGTGTISMKLAGGATAMEGENGAKKPMAERCYVGVYLAETDQMIAKQENTYFLKHTTSYVNPAQYSANVYNTDNYYTYRLDLSEYLGKEMYLKIIDNDRSYYYGYLSVDDVRTYSEEGQQATGAAYDKIRTYGEAQGTEYQIANGDFETGDLSGWTVTEGFAFSHAGVNASDVWWNENITYNREGNYHYGHYNPTATGRMRSTEFTLGGSGYVSFRLGGCANNGLTYLRFVMVKEDGEEEEVARFSNERYWNAQFPYVSNGMKLLNLIHYYADLSEFLGKKMYIEVVDENTSADDLGCITMDSIVTYHEEKPTFMYQDEAYEIIVEVEYEPENEYQLKNGTFETGDLTGWTMEGDIGSVSSAYGWWDANFPYNKKGKYLFTGIDKETGTGTLTSDAFTLGGCGWISFRLGGGKNPLLCYVSVLDAETNEELVRFANKNFRDMGTSGINVNSFLANMNSYKVDLTQFGIELGTSLKIRITDNATNNWGLITADSFITYYESESDLPTDAVLAEDATPVPEEESEYQIANGGFETGDLTGWTVTSGTVANGAVTTGDTFWDEGIPYNNEGYFHFDGWQANGDEAATYSLRSETFTLGGSGHISFRMGGRTAVLRVYTEDGTKIAEYGNPAFTDVDFPHVDNGCRLATMTTYVADLSDYLGETLYVEICDVALGDGENWGVVFFDDIVTYYETAPVVSERYDVVSLNSATSSTNVAQEYHIAWQTAQNLLGNE